ncbi:carbohydrate-binding protein [Paenibacillus azoreducens]|uniref:chitinase n=1 Tax=Paenibacillus azoreducens TaxID=116718 RepID=A0A919Y5F4_9BACL|nr:glycosyl hydrolase family 18 protein [Paenibacillus azoreducens]GIO45261.1 hypothetical protein J34TS1_00260 [Paenibacillus azoreducens]
MGVNHFTFRKPRAISIIVVLILSLLLFGSFNTPKAHAAVANKTIVGYWHNFENGSGFIKLRDVSPKFDVINVSFAEPTAGVTNGAIGFTPFNYTDAEFKADVAYLQSQGKKVIISIGGANGQVQLASTAARDNFVSSVTAIIEKYGFDGLDVDFEGHSLYLNAGDSDFKNPTTPVIVNLITALRTINDHFGTDKFYLTMAPETFFVQLGYSFYGGSCISCDNRSGAYLPVIYATRDILDWLQVQNYNSGPITGLDDQYHNMGSADFHVAMADMLLTGFPVAKNPNSFFPALRPDQVLLGLPASPNAGGGFTSVAEVQKALDALIKGKQLSNYQMRGNASGYPNFRGLMTWSINWDKFNHFEFSDSHRAYLDALSPSVPDTQPPTAPTNVTVTAKSSTSVSLSWTASTDNVGVTGYTITYGASSVNVSGTNTTISGLEPNTSYQFTVTARDAAGNISTGTTINVTTDAGGGGNSQGWAANVSYKANDEVAYGGKTYICRQPHTSLPGWEPPNVPALWQVKQI